MRAIAKNVEFMMLRAGRPNETFDTPRLVFMPSFVSSHRHSKVTSADDESELTVMARQSTIISLDAMP